MHAHMIQLPSHLHTRLKEEQHKEAVRKWHLMWEADTGLHRQYAEELGDLDLFRCST